MTILINSLTGGGAERQVSRIVRFFPIERLLLLERDVQYEIGGVQLDFVSQHRNSTRTLLKFLSIPLYARRLKPFLRNRQLIVSFMERSNFVNIIAKMLYGQRAVVCERTNPQLAFEKGPKRINGLLIRLLYPKADLIIVNARETKEALTGYFHLPPEKIRVVYNCFDVEQIVEKSREDIPSHLEKAFRKTTFITAGRLLMQKGYHGLLRIFSGIRSEIGDSNLIFLGEGQDYGRLRDLGKALGLSVYSDIDTRDTEQKPEAADILFLGFQKNVFHFFAGSTVFVMTSLYEGFPNVLVEAMASRLAVVSSDCRSGPREILAPDTDFRFETDRPENAEYGILMPVLSGSPEGDVANPTAEETMWIETLKKLVKNRKTLEKYSDRGYERSRDFDTVVVKKQWEAALKAVM